MLLPKRETLGELCSPAQTLAGPSNCTRARVKIVAEPVNFSWIRATSFATPTSSRPRTSGLSAFCAAPWQACFPVHDRIQRNPASPWQWWRPAQVPVTIAQIEVIRTGPGYWSTKHGLPLSPTGRASVDRLLRKASAPAGRGQRSPNSPKTGRAVAQALSVGFGGGECSNHLAAQRENPIPRPSRPLIGMFQTR